MKISAVNSSRNLANVRVYDDRRHVFHEQLWQFVKTLPEKGIIFFVRVSKLFHTFTANSRRYNTVEKGIDLVST